MSINEDIKEVKDSVEELKQENFASMILRDYKKANKRIFILAMSLLVALIISIGYIIYLLNDINYVETIQTIEDVSTIENSNISNGE